MTTEKEEAGIRIYNLLGRGVENITNAIDALDKHIENPLIPRDSAIDMALFTLSQGRDIMANSQSLKDLHEGIPGRMEEYKGLIDTYQDKIDEVQFD